VNQNMYNGIKKHKVKAKKNLTLMLFYDPVKSGIMLKVPKWIRFPLMALAVFILLSGLQNRAYIAELEKEVAKNRLEAKEGIHTISNKETEIAVLEETDAKRYKQLNMLGLLTVELQDKLKELQTYKQVIDEKLGLTEATTEHQPNALANIIQATPVVSLSNKEEQSIEKEILEKIAHLQGEEGIDYIGEPTQEDTFSTKMNKLLEEVQATIDLTEEEEVLYTKRDEQVDIMLPYWEAYPSVMPLADTYITSYYGYRQNPFGYTRGEFHSGVDFKATYEDVWATGSGVVIFAGYTSGYGNMVVIDHGYGITTKYAHNSELYVKKGDHVKRYDRISKSGNTGRSTGPHLHYEILVDGETQNPLDFIHKGDH